MEPLNQVLFKREDIQRATTRMAHEILESENDQTGLLLVGIETRGAQLVRRIAEKIGSFSGTVPPVETIDITLFRDDQEGRIDADAVSAPFSISVDDKTLVLVDDVIYTGRTIRAALDLVFQLGKPKKILVAVLVDRGDRELPIKADIVGKNVQVSGAARVNVLLSELDGVDQVTVSGERDRNLRVKIGR
ncbi:MAG: bifunctional pyr operon transcriptional regulator/uracil phosphoribosyltransferase PyrR [Deltaproteobacteria bacterium]|nr:bifunctional pyr operon transcriptional regulator/uracil phosphoribosyltransferase PyrR [Deltaproteobacteria bacterium]